MNIRKYLKTAALAFGEKTGSGLLYLLPEYALQLMTMAILMMVWNVLIDQGVDIPMTKAQMLSYTFVSFTLRDFLNIHTDLSSWNYEGQLINLYMRPLGVFGQVIAQTLGKLLPRFLLFSLPLFFIAPLFGIHTIPASALFFVSLAFSISVGFAIDFLFSCLSIRLMNVKWLIITIRRSITTILSGAIIPFSIMPFGLDKVLPWQPFGSLAGAPLSIFTGSRETWSLITAQFIWNLALWPFVFYVWNKSRERLVSFGG